MHGGRSGQSGQSLILFIFMIAAFAGFVALTVDVGIALVHRASFQAGVDASALAGASALPDKAEATSLAQRWANANGLNNSGVTVTITTPYDNDPEKIEVTAGKRVSPLFARAIGWDGFDISARAVAGVTRAGIVDAAFLLLAPNTCQAFNKTGNANLDIIGNGGIMINSSCNPSIRRVGTGSVSAEAINYYQLGGVTQNGSGTLSPTPASVRQTVADPLANTSAPDLTSGQSPDSGGTAAAPATKVLNGGNVTLHPGVYYGGIEVRSTTNVTLLPGIYALAGGGFKLSGSGNITGAGVMLYNTYDPQHNSGAGACGAIDTGGSAVLSLSPPASGAYKDIGMWQDKACTVALKIVGGNGPGAGGVVYAPAAKVNMSGGGALGSIQVIASTVDVSGTGNLSVNFVSYISIPLTFKVKLIE